MLKIGFILSAGGATFDAALRLANLSHDFFHVVVDRNCGALEKAQGLGVSANLCQAAEREEFSESAYEAFRNAGCDLVLMHFSRLVSGALYDRILTINLHPSQLPAFPGLNSVAAAHVEKKPIQGATLHLVDAGIDTGRVLAQTISSVPAGVSLAQRRSLSYRQKVVLTLALLDWVRSGRVDPASRDLSAFDFRGLGHTQLCAPGFHGLDMQTVAQDFLSSPPVF